jgi:hypothetical protein
VLEPAWILAAECALAALAALLALGAPQRGARVLAGLLVRARRGFPTLPRLALCCALLGGVGSAALALLVHWPEPRVHDEFSYLLASDTFSSGRLTNHSPALAAPFETFHVLLEPTYSSKYPTGQGLVLALGQAPFGEPLVGVWLMAAALGAALAWFFWVWLPRGWSAVAALLCTSYLALASYWTQSYWGGALACLGGALAFGALQRLARAVTPGSALSLGTGFALWMLSRPFEGSIAALPALVWFARVLLRSSADWRERARALAWSALVPSLTLGWILVHNWAVTGSPWSVPYFAYDARYAVAPPFLWGEPAPEPMYHSSEVRDYWTGFAEREFARQRSVEGWLLGFTAKTRVYLSFYATPLMALPMFCLWRVRRRRGTPFALSACCLMWGSSLVWTYNLPHYSAPVAPLAALLFFRSLRGLTGIRRPGPWAARASPALAGWTSLFLAAVPVLRCMRAPDVSWPEQRAGIQKGLEREQQPSLVLVSYGPDHSIHDEWVFNGADLERGHVLWARDLGPEWNARLRQHYPGRRFWRLRVERGDEPDLNALD